MSILHNLNQMWMLNKHWLSRIWRKAPLWQLEDPRTWIDVSCEFTAYSRTETLHVMLGTHKIIISHTGHWTLDIWKSYSSDLRTEFPLPCKVQLAEDRRCWWCWGIRGGSWGRAAEEARRPTSWAAGPADPGFPAGDPDGPDGPGGPKLTRWPWWPWGDPEWPKWQFFLRQKAR